MGMDVDYIVAEQAIRKLKRLLEDMEHGSREEICDDIESFVKAMKVKYRKKIK